MPLLAPFVPPRYGGGIGATVTRPKTALSGTQQGAATMLNTVAKVMAILSGTQKQSGTIGAKISGPTVGLSDTRPPVIFPPTAALSGSQQQSGVMGATVSKPVTVLTGTEQPKGAINVTAQEPTYSSGGITGGFVTRDAATGNLMLGGQRYRFSGPNTAGIGISGGVPQTAYGAVVNSDGYHLPTHSEIDAILAEATAMNANMIRAWGAVHSVGRVSSVQPTLGNFNVAALEPIDYLLQRATALNIRVIFPLVDNYEYGPLGKKWYCDVNGVSSANDSRQFFINTTVINSFKAHISFVINHVNQYTGTRYGDDPRILAWETGNEIGGGDTTVPLTNADRGAWLTTIATHIKTTLSAQQLVMDGGYGIGDAMNSTVPIERLSVPLCDMYTDHTYDQFRFPSYLESEGSMCKAWGKAFYVGEITPFGLTTAGGSLPWTREEAISQAVGSTNIDGMSVWNVIAPAFTADAFSVRSPGTSGITTTMKYAGNLWADLATEMATRTQFGPRLVAKGVGNTVGQSYRAFTFDTSVYDAEADDLVIIIGGNNSSPGNGVVAADSGGWFNPLGSGVGLTVDTTSVGVMCHWVTPAEHEAQTVTYTAPMWTITSWGGQACFILRNADRNNPIDSINTLLGTVASTTHVLPGLTGANLSNDSLVVSAIIGISNPSYTTPTDTWSTLGTSIVDQSVWGGKLNKLTNAGVSVAARNMTASASTKYISISIAINKAPAVSYTAISPAINQVGAIGDSITDYGSAYNYQPWLGPIYLNQLHVLTNQRMRFGGVWATGGWHMTQIRDTHLPEAIAAAPGAVIMFLGTNDQGRFPAVNQRTFKGMVRKLLDAGIAPILVTILPRDDNPTSTPGAITWNAFIKQFAAANGYAVLDAWTAVSDPDNTYKTGYTSDGLHPTEIAYRAIADQGITDGLPAIFPATPAGLTSTSDSHIDNLFNVGGVDLGLFANDANSDGVADGFTKSSTGIFSLAPVTGWAGNGQKLRHSTTGQTVSITRAVTGYTTGIFYRFACRVRTTNISTTATQFFLQLDATVPGGYTMPQGTVLTSNIRIGAVQWTADTGVVGGDLLIAEFTMPPGTTALNFTASMTAITAGEDPSLTIGELTLVRADLPTGAIGATVTDPTASLSGAVPVISNIAAQIRRPTASLTGAWSVPIIDGGSPSAAGPDIVNAGSPSAAGPDIIDASTV